MAAYRWHESEFIAEVAARRGLTVTGGRGSPWTVSGGTPGVTWTVTHTPASGETGPEIEWRCPELRAGDDAAHQLVVRRTDGEGSTLGDGGDDLASAAALAVVAAIGGFFGRRRKATPTDSSTAPPPMKPVGVLGPNWSVIDPSGVLGPELAPTFDSWPDAWWGPGDERPARLDSVWLNQYGLHVTAHDWWCSAPALDQLIGLGEELAGRLRRAGF